MGEHAPKLPIPGKRNMLVTSALPYVNNVPHLGNIIGCKYHAIHKEVYEWFDISFDVFGRTSTPKHTEICQAIFKKLMENKFLSENTIQQLYCNRCQRFLADRFVEGTCPYEDCKDTSAKGDQCQKCGKLLDPMELKDPKCKPCRSTPVIRDTTHLFLELPLMENELREYVESTSGSWSKISYAITKSWLTQGLEPRCISRDLKWGVPVPHDKFKDKVLYVWFDAPIGYISITASYTPDWEKWWKNPEQVELYQFMGEDNVPFHSLIFPSTLLGTRENWTLLKTLSATSYLKYGTDKGKFSKSEGTGVFGNDAKSTNIPVEVWRYYLLSIRPEGGDATFAWDDLKEKLNSELNHKLGNFINRVLKFVALPPGAGYDSVIPDAPGADSHLPTIELALAVGQCVDDYLLSMEKVELTKALKKTMEIADEGNRYLTHNQIWKLFKEDTASCCIIMKTAVGLVYLLGCLLGPFMPAFSQKVFKQLNMPLDPISLSDERGNIYKSKRPWEIIPAGHRIGTPEPLFTKLKDVASFEKRFGAASNKNNKKKQQTR
ncbi:hypothetical protein Tsubulata_026337 [Turnera subulata]|uniref:methionine--tRNA ligase n=1 Tax=Turnera subulata TaxID=218843 RepID=A0A9Q0F3R9_9ROSI|nr:hypothetical protein Tsubulata_026337 [Turnera subulata]